MRATESVAEHRERLLSVELSQANLETAYLNIVSAGDAPAAGTPAVGSVPV
jgi:hypothetical protein